MWNKIILIEFLVVAASLTTSHGEGYSYQSPDNPLVLPTEASTLDSSIAGYPKIVPDVPFQIPSGSEFNPDRLPFGANDDQVTAIPPKHNKHGSDGKYDHADDGTAWDIRKSIPGEPDRDYPVYASVPSTSFTCADKVPGYYADLETRCQVFRVCTTGSIESFNSFLCPNGSLFNQAVQTCDWWRSVDCAGSSKHYYKNNEIQKMPEGSQFMYEIEKMLQLPLEDSYENNALDSQVQESEAHNALYLPPIQKTSTTRKYYTATVPATTPKLPTTHNFISTQNNAYPTTTGTYKPEFSVQSKVNQQYVTHPPPSTDYLPLKHNQNHNNEVTQQPQYVTPGVFVSQQKPSQSQSPNSNTNELHVSPKLQTTPPLQVSNTPATLKVSKLIKAKLPQPLYVSGIARPIEPFTSKPSTPQALKIPETVPTIDERFHTEGTMPKLQNVNSFLSQIGQFGTSGQGYDAKTPSITFTKEEAHSVSRTQDTKITQASGPGPEKVSLLDVQQPTEQPIQTGNIDLGTSVPATDFKFHINVGDISTSSTPNVINVPDEELKVISGGVTTITKEEAFKNIDNIRTQLQQIIPQEETSDDVDLRNLISTTQGSVIQDGSLEQDFLQKGISQGSVLQGSISQAGIVQQDSSQKIDSGKFVQQGISQGLLESGISQENKIQQDVSRLLQTGSQGISQQDALFQGIVEGKSQNSDTLTYPYFGNRKIDIRFKSQQSQAQSNQNDAFGIHKSLELPYNTGNQFQQGFELGAINNAGGFQDYASEINQGIQTNGQNFNNNPYFGYPAQGFQNGFIGVQGINPNYHEENVQNYNYHLKNNGQNQNYEQLQNGRIQKYTGESISQHAGGQNENINYHTHSSYNGQNVAYKESIKVQIVPSLGFTLTEDLGRQDYVNALLNGIIQGQTNLEALPKEGTSTGEILPKDVRFSSYQGPSSYLAPQASVQRLPSDSGYIR